ncbi:MAG: hypothetical protein E6K72_08920 [Candidatus Eisenbacteria bacterium]|uniref:MurNAc-LAA domain-containing protein n=1 Tax=Eiseniibacteriota bacterium TaxID=2212470 RepID=A0A538SMX8_UNCEI|nr:MAG: hypothetical protein E6K72_08920 [Candidatus Eisenbacteria bacterium]
MEVSSQAEAYRVVREPRAGRIVIELSKQPGPGLDAFAPEGLRGARTLRVVALDPGHGGSDAGVTVGDVVEKDLTLALARQLKTNRQPRAGRPRALAPLRRVPGPQGARCDRVLPARHLRGRGRRGPRGIGAPDPGDAVERRRDALRGRCARARGSRARRHGAQGPGTESAARAARAQPAGRQRSRHRSGVRHPHRAARPGASDRVARSRGACGGHRGRHRGLPAERLT